MIMEQKIMFTQKSRELVTIGDEIAKLNLLHEWIILFTKIAYSRGWVSVDEMQKSQMLNIATVNSQAVLFLANQGKKVGLSLLERLSTELKEERMRLKAVSHILKHGVKDSKKTLEIIFNQSINEPTLLDFM